MPSKTGVTVKNSYPKDLCVENTSTTVGIDGSTRKIIDGVGVNTAISLSDDSLIVRPENDDTTGTFGVRQVGGNYVLTADTTNSKVLVGSSQVNATTMYANFNINNVVSAGLSADYHYAIPFFGNTALATYHVMGSSTSSSFNDTDPASTLTIATTAQQAVTCYWYVMDDITIDAVKWLHGADAATGDSTAAHLMSYTVDTANGSTGGDLSAGTVLADGGTITNAGYEQIYYQSITNQSAEVDSGKVILFTFASDTINSDISIQATVKYFIR